MNKVLEKIEDVRDAVSEAIDRWQITSAPRRSAIDEALLELEQALRRAQQ